MLKLYFADLSPDFAVNVTVSTSVNIVLGVYVTLIPVWLNPLLGLLISFSTLTVPNLAVPVISFTIEPAAESHEFTSTETGKPKSITRSLIPGKLDATILAFAFAVPLNEPVEYSAL